MSITTAVADRHAQRLDQYRQSMDGVPGPVILRGRRFADRCRRTAGPGVTDAQIRAVLECVLDQVLGHRDAAGPEYALPAVLNDLSVAVLDLDGDRTRSGRVRRLRPVADNAAGGGLTDAAP